MQKMEILPVNDLDVALHDFVNKDDKMAFYSCVQYNLEETRVSTFSFLYFLNVRTLQAVKGYVTHEPKIIILFFVLNFP